MCLQAADREAAFLFIATGHNIRSQVRTSLTKCKKLSKQSSVALRAHLHRCRWQCTIKTNCISASSKNGCCIQPPGKTELVTTYQSIACIRGWMNSPGCKLSASSSTHSSLYTCKPSGKRLPAYSCPAAYYNVLVVVHNACDFWEQKYALLFFFFIPCMTLPPV